MFVCFVFQKRKKRNHKQVPLPYKQEASPVLQLKPLLHRQEASPVLQLTLLPHRQEASPVLQLTLLLHRQEASPVLQLTLLLHRQEASPVLQLTLLLHRQEASPVLQLKPLVHRQEVSSTADTSRGQTCTTSSTSADSVDLYLGFHSSIISCLMNNVSKIANLNIDMLQFHKYKLCINHFLLLLSRPPGQLQRIWHTSVVPGRGFSKQCCLGGGEQGQLQIPIRKWIVGWSPDRVMEVEFTSKRGL